MNGGKMYIVVFEYDKTSGSYGSRFIVEYTSKEALDTRENKDDGTVILAEGISTDEAQDLLALTPEICVIFASLEDAYQGVVAPSYIRTDFAYQNAYADLSHRRTRIASRNLTRPDVSEFMGLLNKKLEFDKHFLASSKRLFLAIANHHTGQIISIA